MKIGYARVSTAQQDLTAQLEQLERTAVVKAKGRLRGLFCALPAAPSVEGCSS